MEPLNFTLLSQENSGWNRTWELPFPKVNEILVKDIFLDDSLVKNRNLWDILKMITFLLSIYKNRNFCSPMLLVTVKN